MNQPARPPDDARGPSRTWRERLTRPFQLGAVRTEARRFLGDQSVSSERADAVLLAMTELVSNAEKAAGDGGVVTIELEVRTTEIALVVTNQPVREPVDPWKLGPVTMPDPTTPRGRGLPLVAVFATRLRIDSDAVSTRVRADFLR